MLSYCPQDDREITHLCHSHTPVIPFEPPSPASPLCQVLRLPQTGDQPRSDKDANIYLTSPGRVLLLLFPGIIRPRLPVRLPLLLFRGHLAH